MTYINNTLINRFATAHQPAKSDPVHLLSNRHTQPLEQTTSESKSSDAHPESGYLTYTNIAPGGKGGRAVLSSQRAVDTSTTPSAPQPVSQFESMEAVKALVAQFGAGAKLPKAGELFDLTVQTKDGDTVTLSINVDASNKDGKVSLASESHFSFAVAGELSDKERKAVDALVSRLGDIAMAYQKDGWADVEFLDVLDGDFIAGLDLSVAGEKNNALSITYSLNSDTGMQTLAVNQNDYEYEIDAQAILDSAKLPLESNEVYLQYQQILMDATQSYKAGEFSGGVKNKDAVAFFLDGLAAIVTPLKSAKSTGMEAPEINYKKATSTAGDSKINSDRSRHRDDSGSQNETSAKPKGSTEEAFLSGISDFSASFNTPLFTPNALNRGEVSQMSLSMEQVTEVSVKRSSGVKTVEQSYSYESRVSQHFGIGRDSVEHANLADANEPGGQTYLYEVVEQAASLTRILDMDTNGKALAYLEEKDSEEEKRTKTVVNGSITDIKKEDLTDPQENYSYALQAINAVTKVPLRASQMTDYVNIKTLEEAIKSARIDFYL